MGSFDFERLAYNNWKYKTLYWEQIKALDLPVTRKNRRVGRYVQILVFEPKVCQLF